MPSLPSTARSTYLAPLDTRGRVAEVERRLADAIRSGVFADGDQLPAEAELASHFGVATVTLREALAGLRTKGLVRTRRGRGGGTFVHAPAAEAEARMLAHLDTLTVDDIRDLGDHRRAVAEAVAALAAERVSEGDLERLAGHVERLRAAGSAAERRAADARFHVELAATTRSLRLTRAEMDVQKEAGGLVALALGEADAARVLADHAALLAAVSAGDARRARELVARHVDAETTALARLHLERVRPLPGPVLPRVCERLEDVFGEIEAIRATVLALEPEPARAALGPVRETVYEILGRRDLIAGAGMVFAPGAVADAGRWLEWWRRESGGAPVFLNAALDPAEDDFYDYEQAEWFTTPRETGRRWIAGPFVDHSGTNEHILTLTVPVVRDGRFLGVAGADVAVGGIEAVAGPALASADGVAALVNHRGRIIATNDPQHLVGTFWPGARDGWPPPSGTVAEQHDGIAWTVVRG